MAFPDMKGGMSGEYVLKVRSMLFTGKEECTYQRCLKLGLHTDARVLWRETNNAHGVYLAEVDRWKIQD
jgi:hypothetical protein